MTGRVNEFGLILSGFYALGIQKESIKKTNKGRLNLRPTQAATAACEKNPRQVWMAIFPRLAPRRYVGRAHRQNRPGKGSIPGHAYVVQRSLAESRRARHLESGRSSVPLRPG